MNTTPNLNEAASGGSSPVPCSRSFESLETPLTDKYVSERNGMGYNVAADDAAFMRGMEQTYGKWRNRCASAEKNLTTIVESHTWCSMRLEKLTPAATAVVDRWETPLWKEAPATAVFIHALRDALQSPENDQV